MRSVAPRRLGLAAGLALAAVAAACGGGRSVPTTAPVETSPATTAASTPVAASLTLCRTTARLDRLVVRRTDEFPQNQVRFSFPALVTVTRGASVRTAAKALCDLPRMPSGTFHCPNDLGVSYRLAFGAPGRTLPPVEIDASGCEVVRGLGSTRWVARNLDFWRVLGTAMGLVAADQSTFAGTPANS